MPTPSQFRDILVQAISDVLTPLNHVDGFGEMSSAFDAQHEVIPPDEVRIQLQSFTLNQTTNPDSEANYRPSVLVKFFVHWKMAVAEIDWTGDGMQIALFTFVNPDWWRGLSGYHYLDSPPEGGDVARVGDVVSFSVTATVTIDPP